jgi:hypothetical protein
LEDLSRLWGNLVDTVRVVSMLQWLSVIRKTYPLIRTTKTNFSSAGI